MIVPVLMAMALTLQGCSDNTSSDDGMKKACNLKSTSFKLGYEVGFENTEDKVEVFLEFVRYIFPKGVNTEKAQYLVQIMMEEYAFGYMEGQSFESMPKFAIGTGNFESMVLNNTSESCRPYVDEFQENVKY
jgi:hypothetical protein